MPVSGLSNTAPRRVSGGEGTWTPAPVATTPARVSGGEYTAPTRPSRPVLAGEEPKLRPGEAVKNVLGGIAFGLGALVLVPAFIIGGLIDDLRHRNDPPQPALPPPSRTPARVSGGES